MVLDLIILAGIALLAVVLYPIPNIPETPASVETASELVLENVAIVMGFLQMIYGATLLTAIFTIIFVIFTFDYLYRAVMWVVRKIPILSIR